MSRKGETMRPQEKVYEPIDWKNIEDFYFPVKKVPVWYGEDGTFIAESDQAIIREDTNELIKIVPDTYKLTPNREIIEPLVERLNAFDNTSYISTQSYLSNGRMRLSLNFPDFKVNDGESEIMLQANIFNSYDMSQSLMYMYGGIRAICMNGSIFGNIFKRLKRKHTKGLTEDFIMDFMNTLKDVDKYIPALQERINLLDAWKVSPDFVDEVMESVGSTIIKEGTKIQLNKDNEVEHIPLMTRWQLYNMLTYYVYHNLKNIHMRTSYDMRISKLFKI